MIQRGVVIMTVKKTGTTDANTDSKNKEMQTKIISAQAKLVKISAEECKALCKTVGLVYLEGYEQRVIEHVISDETADRCGDIMRAKGVDTTNYMKNAVILFCHDRHDFPVGKSLKVWTKGKEVRSWGLYFDERVDPSGRADLAFRFISNGGMPAVSVGFISTKVNRPVTFEERVKLGLGRWGTEILEWELLEYSSCPVPCNPNALKKSMHSLSNKDMEILVEAKLIPDEIFEDFVKEMGDILSKGDFVSSTMKVFEKAENKDEGVKGPDDTVDPKENPYYKKLSTLEEKVDKLTSILEPLLNQKTSDVIPTPSSEPETKSNENVYDILTETIKLD